MSVDAPQKRSFLPPIRKGNLIRWGFELAVVIALACLVIFGHPEVAFFTAVQKGITTPVVVAVIAAAGLVAAPTVTGLLNIHANNVNAKAARELALENARIQSEHAVEVKAATERVADRVVAEAEKVALKADEVATELARTRDVTDKKLDKITVLVDGRYGSALDVIADVKEKIARLFPGDAEAQHAAVEARSDATRHATSLSDLKRDEGVKS